MQGVRNLMMPNTFAKRGWAGRNAGGDEMAAHTPILKYGLIVAAPPLFLFSFSLHHFCH